MAQKFQQDYEYDGSGRMASATSPLWAAGQTRKGRACARHIRGPFSMAADGRRRQSKLETGNEWDILWGSFYIWTKFRLSVKHSHFPA